MAMTPQERAELAAMIQQIIASNSPEPFYNSVAQPMDKYGNPEPWDLANQAKAQNVVQDQAQIYSDPAILGGWMPDTVTPEMLTQYEPLAGWNKVEAAAVNQPDSLSGIIAAKILAGGDAIAAYTEIVNVLSTPDADPAAYERLAPLIPLRPSDGMTATNDPLSRWDLDAVKKLAESYQSAVNGEPIPQIDPATNDYVRDQNGRIAITTETPQGQWFRETGTPLPWAEWNTNDFATPTQQMRRDESFAKTAGTESEWRDFRSQTAAPPRLAGADREAYINNLMQSNMTTPDYPGFTNQSNQTGSFEGRRGSEGAWASLDDDHDQTSGPNFGFLGDAANLYGEGMALTINPMMALRRGTEALGGVADWVGGLASSETQSGGMSSSGGVTPDYPFAPGASATSQPKPAASFRGDASWATPEGGAQRNGPARGSRYEAELRLLNAERDRGPTGRKATPESATAFQKVRAQRAKNHKQLADEALRKRMIAQLMSAGITPHTNTMNTRRSQAQQAGFGY